MNTTITAHSAALHMWQQQMINDLEFLAFLRLLAQDGNAMAPEWLHPTCQKVFLLQVIPPTLARH